MPSCWPPTLAAPLPCDVVTKTKHIYFIGFKVFWKFKPNISPKCEIPHTIPTFSSDEYSTQSAMSLAIGHTTLCRCSRASWACSVFSYLKTEIFQFFFVKFSFTVIMQLLLMESIQNWSWSTVPNLPSRSSRAFLVKGRFKLRMWTQREGGFLEK